MKYKAQLILSPDQLREILINYMSGKQIQVVSVDFKLEQVSTGYGMSERIEPQFTGAQIKYEISQP